MDEIGFEDQSKEAKTYLEAVETCRRSTQQVTHAIENVVTLLAKTASTYDKVVRYPGTSQDMVTYYLDSSRRLNSFLLNDMESFRAVWANNVVYQLDDLAYSARSATTTAKRRREARERYLKSSQKPSNPFASAVSPEKVKQRKEEYVLCSEQFNETYKAFNGLRMQTVGVLQAHYFHDHSVMLRKLSEAMKLRSTPPLPPPPLHARDDFNADGLLSPSGSLESTAAASAGPFGSAQFPSGARLTVADSETSFSEQNDNGRGEDGTHTTAGGGGVRRPHHHHYPPLHLRSSNHVGDLAAFQEVSEDHASNGTPDARSGPSRAESSAGLEGSGDTPPPANSVTQLPPMRFETVVKPSDQQRPVHHAEPLFATASGATNRPEAEPASSANRYGEPVHGIPVAVEPSPFRQYAYQSRASLNQDAEARSNARGVPFLNAPNTSASLSDEQHNRTCSSNSTMRNERRSSGAGSPRLSPEPNRRSTVSTVPTAPQPPQPVGKTSPLATLDLAASGNNGGSGPSPRSGAGAMPANKASRATAGQGTRLVPPRQPQGVVYSALDLLTEADATYPGSSTSAAAANGGANGRSGGGGGKIGRIRTLLSSRGENSIATREVNGVDGSSTTPFVTARALYPSLYSSTTTATRPSRPGTEVSESRTGAADSGGSRHRSSGSGSGAGSRWNCSTYAGDGDEYILDF